MRRILAAAALGGALFAAAACGGDNGTGDGGDGGSTPDTTGSLTNEEVCAAGNELGTELETEFQEAGQALLDAAATGDEAAMAEAGQHFTDVTGELAGRMRDIAADAEDPELKSAIEDFATELEALTDALASDPSALEELDTTALDDASNRLDELCPQS